MESSPGAVGDLAVPGHAVSQRVLGAMAGERARKTARGPGRLVLGKPHP
ncbi:hypothetical protein [Saccharopolyspora phatthalungensis]|nr:hypothetical protein [Saccharopolyspora phatthalungensis]